MYIPLGTKSHLSMNFDFFNVVDSLAVAATEALSCKSNTDTQLPTIHHLLGLNEYTSELIALTMIKFLSMDVFIKGIVSLQDNTSTTPRDERELMRTDRRENEPEK